VTTRWSKEKVTKRLSIGQNVGSYLFGWLDIQVFAHVLYLTEVPRDVLTVQ